MGEAKRKEMACQELSVALDTFGGWIHVEWNPNAAVTPLGQLPFFIEFLKVSGLFEAWVADCPLSYQSNNAPDKRDVLATFLLSILAGHHRLRTSRRFAKIAFTRIYWASNNWSRKMRHDAPLRNSTKRPAKTGWIVTSARPHNHC